MRELIRKSGVLLIVFRQYVKNIGLYLKTHKTNGSSEKSVFFDLKDRRVEPYYYILIRSFHEANYTIYLNHRFLFIGSLATSGHHLFALSSLFLKSNIRKKNNPNCTLINDYNKNYAKYRFSKHLQISFDVFSPKLNHESFFVLPFCMSPKQYVFDYHKHAAQLRRSVKSMSILFSGNQLDEAYDHPVIRDFFKKMNRIEIIGYLLQNLENHKTLVIKKSKDWKIIDKDFQNKFVLNKWKWSPKYSENLDSRVADDKWLHVLARSNFFLATPGIRMPLCFNVIEAMAVGCIPIIEYPEYFSPPLQHQKNCLVFNGQEGLVDQVEKALHMNQKEIYNLRTNVFDYYDTYLRIEKIPTMIDNIQAKKATLYINATEISLMSFKSNQS